MIRIPVLATLLALTLASAAPAAAQSFAALAPTPAHPVLKRQAFVSGDLVRIGDLVDNAGIVADIPIFRAPDPGQTGTVPASRVAEAVRAHAIIGLDTAGAAEVVVTRMSRAIVAKDLEARIAGALAARYRLGPADELLLSFDREPATVHVDPSADDPKFVRLAYDERSSRFDAVLDVPGRPLRLTGTAVPGTSAAIVVRAIARGEVLQTTDVVVERRPKAAIGVDAVKRAELAVGLAARHPMAAGHVVVKTDLAKPDLVVRDTEVTLMYQVPGIMLTVRGKALDSGAEGDVVNVLNAQSKRTVQGIVAGPNRVFVGSAAPRVAANLDPASSDTSNAQRKRPE